MAFRTTRNRRRADSTRQGVAKERLARSGPSLARLGMTVGLTVAIAFGARAVFAWAVTSRTFALRRITFEGATRATRAELLKLGGLSLGQNLLEVDGPGAVRAMKAHPWVKDVSITRHLPSALVVHVEEHAPAALVALGELYLLDSEGEPFKKVQASDALDIALPLVTGIDREAYVERPAEVRGRFRAALQLARDYGAGRGAALSEIRLEDGGAALVTAQGQEIRLGEGKLAEKLARLAKVRAELLKRGLSAESIHLDNRTRPGWVTVKLSSLPSERWVEAKK
jgi:cell division protein FtsQ